MPQDERTGVPHIARPNRENGRQIPYPAREFPEIQKTRPLWMERTQRIPGNSDTDA